MPSISHEEQVSKLIANGADKGKMNLKLAWAIATGNTDYPKTWPKKVPFVEDYDQDEEDKEDPKRDLSLMFWDALDSIRMSSSMIPDAFKIMPSKDEWGMLTIFEVVKSNDIDPKKYAELWFYLDCEFWDLELVVVSHHGNVMGEYSPAAIGTKWYEKLEEDVVRGA